MKHMWTLTIEIRELLIMQYVHFNMEYMVKRNFVALYPIITRQPRKSEKIGEWVYREKFTLFSII